ncbi:hypothetical protein C8T65DRAFT_664063 [Cerioporus squamosus]|nr:hypothetical protein C8T65DRAFT_664063 [Cerioporus squamosus]
MASHPSRFEQSVVARGRGWVMRLRAQLRRERGVKFENIQSSAYSPKPVNHLSPLRKLPGRTAPCVGWASTSWTVDRSREAVIPCRLSREIATHCSIVYKRV